MKPKSMASPDAWIAAVATMAYIASVVVNSKLLGVVAGSPVVFYLPGAVLLRMLPQAVRAVDRFERVALSCILSVCAVALLAFGLDYTGVGITRLNLSVCVLLFVDAGIVGFAIMNRRERRIRVFDIAAVGASYAISIAWLMSIVVIGHIGDALFAVR